MEENKLHNIIMEKREKLSISGVKDIGIYNEEIVELSTVMGELVVKGSNMHINKFNTEDGELKAFLFSLGCYSGEPITVIDRKRSTCVVSIKDARYCIDKALATTILV